MVLAAQFERLILGELLAWLVDPALAGKDAAGEDERLGASAGFDQPAIDKKLVNELATLRFLEDATNVLFIGPPGVGKTMLAVALARASIDAGYRTYYFRFL